MAMTGAAALAMALAACSGGTGTTNDAVMNDTAFGNDMGLDNMVDGNMMAAGGAAIAALKPADGKDDGSATDTAAAGAHKVAPTASGLPDGTNAVPHTTTGHDAQQPFKTARCNRQHSHAHDPTHKH